MDGIVFTNAHPRYARKLDDPHGGDTTIRMEQVKEVMMANHEIEDESSWIWITSERMGFPLRSEFANENQGESGSSKQCNQQRTDQTAFFLVPIITDCIRNTKRVLYDEQLENALEMLVGFRSKFTVTSNRRVCKNPRRVVTLGKTPW